MATQIVNTEEHTGNMCVTDFQMQVYYQGIKALLRGMVINRNFTSTNCRAFVTYCTGIEYKAGKKGLKAALMDLELLLLKEKTA